MIRRAASGILALGCVFVCLSPSLWADDEVPPPRIDSYVAIFGGLALPTRTDVRVQGQNRDFTVFDQSFGRSRSLGGKVGAWFTATRARTGVDVGLELDITNFQPDLKTGPFRASGVSRGVSISSITWTNKIDVDATLVAMNLLIRVPLYVSEEYPHGRLAPYGGGGVGFQSTSYGSQSEASSTLGVQAVAGINFFMTRRFSFFWEYKHTHAKQTLLFGSTSAGTFSEEKYTFAVNHLLFGLALHF